MSAVKDLDTASKALLSFIVLIVVLLIIYGVIKIFHFGGDTGKNVGKTASNVSDILASGTSAAANLADDAAALLAKGNVPPGEPGSWNKLVARSNGNPLMPETWTGPRSDSTNAAAIAQFIANINALPGNHWYDVFKLGQDLNDIMGGAPAQVVSAFAIIPSQASIYEAVNGYNTQYNDNIYNGIVANLDAATQDSLASIILAKPLTV